MFPFSKINLHSQSMFDFLCVALKLMIPLLCNSATMRSDQQFCTTPAAQKYCLPLILCASLCMLTKIHECTV